MRIGPVLRRCSDPGRASVIRGLLHRGPFEALIVCPQRCGRIDRKPRHRLMIDDLRAGWPGASAGQPVRRAGVHRPDDGLPACPNIDRLYVDQGRPFAAVTVKPLKLPLKHRHQPGRLPEAEVLRFGRFLRHGFAHAIDGGMVHQDDLSSGHPFEAILRLQGRQRRNGGRRLSVGFTAISGEG